MVTTEDATSADGAPFQPTEEWIDAFQSQCTEKLRLDLLAYAKYRARGVGRAGAHVDATYAEDLVADALADTLSGVVAWDPSAKSLYQHGEDTIRYRTRHDRKRARRYRHQRIDAPVSPTEHQAMRGLVEASLLQDRAADSADDAIFATEVIARVRELAANDADVMQYLDAIADGARTRAEIMDDARMSAKACRNARDRLGRIVEQLDQQVVASMRYTRGARA